MDRINSNSDKLNLVPAIREIEAQIKQIEYEHRKKIEPYKKSLEHLREINEACEVCCGAGKVLRSRACAEDYVPDPNDPSDYNTCTQCHGTGMAHIPAAKHA